MLCWIPCCTRPEELDGLNLVFIRKEMLGKDEGLPSIESVRQWKQREEQMLPSVGPAYLYDYPPEMSTPSHNSVLKSYLLMTVICAS
ncbi:hypothetical protein SLEP1_g43266 [Rubroshorea leprosula]|uniref:Uncharacterized protein n=1 Tax=Rubroshorea leprosula TaxID=152421 RepID=A0AAV5LCU9_9ROSI|nr:hypothetical protein SLEP1_g43266 [Rubroshorea leprosula]